MSKKWMGLCSMAVVFMLVAVGGCANKEEEQAAAEQAAEDAAAGEVIAEAVGVPAVGIYVGQLPSADAPGSTLTLVLNTDNSATMSVDYKNDQAMVVENGSWAWNSTASTVDLTIQRDVSGTMVSSMMSFALSGDTLSLNNPVDAGYGDTGVKLVKSGADESHEGHSH